MDTSSPKDLTNTKHKINTLQGNHQGVPTRLPSKVLVSLLHTTSPSNNTPPSSSSNSPLTHLCFSLSSNSNSSSSSVVRMSLMGCNNRARGMKISSKSRLKIISRVLTLSTQGCHWKRLRMARSKEDKQEPKVPMVSLPKQSHLIIIIIMLIQSLRNQGIVIKDRLTSLSKTSSRTSQAIPRQDRVSTRARTLAASSRYLTVLS